MCAFQALSHIDELRFLGSKDPAALDSSDVLQVLHRLLSLILFHHYIRKLSSKRRIIVRIFAMESNFLSLLNLIELQGKCTKSDRVSLTIFSCTGDGEAVKSSMQTRYVARIIDELFATADSILLVEQHGLRLIDLCEKRMFASLKDSDDHRSTTNRFQSTAHSASSNVRSIVEDQIVRLYPTNG